MVAATQTLTREHLAEAFLAGSGIEIESVGRIGDKINSVKMNREWLLTCAALVLGIAKVAFAAWVSIRFATH